MPDAPAIEILRRTPPSDALLLLDCRTPAEHATAKIAGSLLIP
ncbi:MAG: rhodanese, partial [Planctomycetia bacterium]|nr:rhodanese [Planctomycetia bacterium]